MTAATTERAIFAPSISRANITNCVFWAAGAAPDDVVGITAYTDALLGDDTSWWRIQENTASMCALVEIGQSGNSSNHNQNVITGNWGIGRGIDVTAAKPMISLYYNHRGVVRDNNVESYYQGIYMENCWSCIESGDGGEAVRYFLDLKNTNATHFQPLGITQPASYGPAQLVRMTDHNYANVIILPAVTGASGLYTDIASAIALAGTAALNDSTIITPEGVYLDGPVTVTGSLAVSGAANFSGGGEYAGSANLSFWGSWNEAHLVIGAVHIWYDPGLPGLRAKVNAPTSATDGTVLLP